MAPYHERRASYALNRKNECFWTDHSLLTIQLEFKRIPLGPGLWKANRMLLHQKEFRDQLNRRLDYLAKELDPCTSSQDNLDKIKVQVKRFIRSYGRRQASLRSATLDQLQKDRHYIFVSPPIADDQRQRLESIDKEINRLQQDPVDIAALQAGIRWREQGGKSAGYLKRIIHQQRNLQQHTASLANTKVSDLPSPAPGQSRSSQV
ncbi:hypothetical protein [Absidia glauca]|uniref:Uncharacterized protein n=1 Tax=Absidia glauca TaxID=4829 RepID=A0A168MH52_ABSGL|nr:hypothetical protein [Absidia glauca]